LVGTAHSRVPALERVGKTTVGCPEVFESASVPQRACGLGWLRPALMASWTSPWSLGFKGCRSRNPVRVLSGAVAGNGRARNGDSSEEQSFAGCARVSCWLHRLKRVLSGIIIGIRRPVPEKLEPFTRSWRKRHWLVGWFGFGRSSRPVRGCQRLVSRASVRRHKRHASARMPTEVRGSA
jgi:hypothetical protein